jgi:hypothetical protein
MKPFLFACLLSALVAVSASAQDAPAKPAGSPAPAKEDISARSKALELAGAFSNDGYKIRDGFWSGDIEPGRPQSVEVNVYAGNEYWFCVAALPPARKVALSIYNENGQPVESQQYDDGGVAAAGFVPEVSGRYFLKLSLVEGEKSPFCFLYTYK